jgi:hypothetical protein
MLEMAAQLSSLSKSFGGFAYQRHQPEETDLYKIIGKTYLRSSPTLQMQTSRYQVLSMKNSLGT